MSARWRMDTIVFSDGRQEIEERARARVHSRLRCIDRARRLVRGGTHMVAEALRPSKSRKSGHAPFGSFRAASATVFRTFF